LHRQGAPAAAFEVHDAVLAAAVGHVVDREHALGRRVPLEREGGREGGRGRKGEGREREREPGSEPISLGEKGTFIDKSRFKSM